MVFVVHDRTFAFFRGACTRGIYDNMRTAVEAILVERDRAYNRRLLRMCSHHLVEPVACTPTSGWEKGRVENQARLVRERFFAPRLRVRSYEELNALLLDQCMSHARANRHPEQRERPGLIPYAGRIELRHNGRVVGEHRRVFGRDQTVFDPWHYVPVLVRKPGALRNRAPFKDWLLLPKALARVRHKLASAADGDRQAVEILTRVLDDGLAAVEAACSEALREGVHSADVILNILTRQRELPPPMTILIPEALRPRHAPLADCTRYDRLRRGA